jgi:hypothetical protein
MGGAGSVGQNVTIAGTYASGGGSINSDGGGSNTALLYRTISNSVTMFFSPGNETGALINIVQGTLGQNNSSQTTDVGGNRGINGYGAGGGAGNIDNNRTRSGGLNAGNGANSANGTNATPATANRGGGGGGAAGANPVRAGSNGGSGVCIIKYWSAL